MHVYACAYECMCTCVYYLRDGSAELQRACLKEAIACADQGGFVCARVVEGRCSLPPSFSLSLFLSLSQGR